MPHTSISYDNTFAGFQVYSKKKQIQRLRAILSLSHVDQQ